MSVPYIKFMKHASKITKKVTGSRPVLKGVMHRENGSLIVTDSHRLYQVNNAYDTTEDVLKDPKTGGVIEGNYPETSRLLPENEGEFTVKVNVKQALNALKAMKIVVKENDTGKNKLMRMVSREGKLYFTAGDDGTPMQLKYEVGQLDINKETSMAVNSDYLLEGLDFLKDVDFNQVTFNYYGSMRPFTLTAEDTVVLILPIREGY